MHCGEVDDVGAFAPDRRRGEQLDSRRVRGVSRGDVRRKAAPPRPKGAGAAGGRRIGCNKKAAQKVRQLLSFHYSFNAYGFAGFFVELDDNATDEARRISLDKANRHAKALFFDGRFFLNA